MKKYLLSAVLSIVVLVSCKKSSNTNSGNCAITETNLQGSYKVTDATYQSPNSSPAIPEVDVYSNPLFSSYFPACKKDDITSLNAGNSYVYSDAGVTCTPNDSTSGTWKLNADTLIITSGGTSDSAIVSSFNCSTAIVVHGNVFSQGDQLKITFTKQ